MVTSQITWICEADGHVLNREQTACIYCDAQFVLVPVRKVVVIETITESGTEWGVSLTSENPEAKDYFACQNKERALALALLLENQPASSKTA